MSAAQDTLALPVTLVAVALMIGIGLIVNQSVNGVIDAARPGASAAFNTTATSLQNNVFSGYDLASITPIVIGAAAVIAIIVGSLVFTSR